jgi:hypothetical protein
MPGGPPYPGSPGSLPRKIPSQNSRVGSNCRGGPSGKLLCGDVAEQLLLLVLRGVADDLEADPVLRILGRPARDHDDVLRFADLILVGRLSDRHPCCRGDHRGADHDPLQLPPHEAIPLGDAIREWVLVLPKAMNDLACLIELNP